MYSVEKSEKRKKRDATWTDDNQHTPKNLIRYAFAARYRLEKSGSYENGLASVSNQKSMGF